MRKMMIVSDDPLFIEDINIFNDILPGWEMNFFDDIEESWLELSHNKYNLVITDLDLTKKKWESKMPLSRIIEFNNSLNILVLVSKDNLVKNSKFIEQLRVIDFLKKPIDLDNLTVIIAIAHGPGVSESDTITSNKEAT